MTAASDSNIAVSSCVKPDEGIWQQTVAELPWGHNTVGVVGLNAVVARQQELRIANDAIVADLEEAST